MKGCIGEGVLQAYLDGELSPEATREAETHLAACEACADAAGAARAEFALFADSLALDEPLSVPTERLRSNILTAIREMQPAQATTADVRPSLVSWLTLFVSRLAASLSLTPRQLTAFAGFALAALILGALFFALRPDSKTDADGRGEQQLAQDTGNQGAQTPSANKSALTPEASPTPDKSSSEREAVDGVPDGLIVKIRPKIVSPGKGKIRPKIVGQDRTAGEVAAARPSEEVLLPGEKGYLTAIASLKTAVERQGAQSLSPTLRAEYERNLALVNEAIAASRVAAKRNPADKDAQEFLRAAYQDKLDLLSAVADKNQIAAVDR